MIKGFAMLRIGAVGWIEKDAITPCGPLDAICRPLIVAACTSDLHTCYEGAIGERHNMFLGHEAIGEVIEVGNLVKDFKVGDKVVVSSATPDWNAIESQRGFSSHSNGRLAGWKLANTKDGVFAERFHVNDADGNLAHIPKGVALTEAIMLCDMVATGMHCAESAEITPGDTVAVIGLGPVGLMACAAANLMGASEIFVVDRIDFRADIAKKHYGATHYINFSEAPFEKQIMEITNNRGVDRVLVAGGGLSTIGEACECLVNGGIVSNVNYYGYGEHLTIPRIGWDVGMGHKTIKGGMMTGGRYRMEKYARLLATKKLDVNPIVTHKLEGFDKIEEALAIMKDKPKNLIKPIVSIQW